MSDIETKFEQLKEDTEEQHEAVVARLDALDDTVADLATKVDAVGILMARSDTQAAQLQAVLKLVGPLAQHYAKVTGMPMLNEQDVMIASRAHERGKTPTEAPVQFGKPMPPFDAQTSRIAAKRREKLGAK
jgi:hypothetical protein